MLQPRVTTQPSAACSSSSSATTVLPMAPRRSHACSSRYRRPRTTAVTASFFGNLLGLSGNDVNLQDSDPELMEWLKARGLPPQKVAVAQLPGQGRGLVARQRIGKGELLLKVPMDMVLSEEAVLASSSLLRKVTSGLDLPSWSVLALWLAEQRHLARNDSGGGWAPYLAVLPERAGTVLDWLPGEADRWLVGGLRTKAKVITDANAATWSEIAPLAAAAESAGDAPRGMFTRDSVSWGVGLLLSRSVRLDSAGGETVLVPFADFANHSVNADCYLDFDQASSSVGVRVDRGYAPGEQVVISYGPKASSELLLSYGFAPPPGSCPFDAAFLDLSLSTAASSSGSNGDGKSGKQRRQGGKQQAAAAGGGAAADAAATAAMEAKRAAMAELGVPTSESFGVRLDALPEGLLDYIAYLEAPVANASEAKALAEAVLGRGDLPVLPDGTSCEALAFEGLARRCQEALKAYTQDQAADKRLADTVPQGGGYEQREALCASIRLRERAILSRSEFVARQRAKAIRRGQA